MDKVIKKAKKKTDKQFDMLLKKDKKRDMKCEKEEKMAKKKK